MERKIDEQRETLAEEIAKEIEEKHRLDDRAKDKKLADVMKQLEDAQRKGKQGSQQTQGEVAEPARISHRGSALSGNTAKKSWSKLLKHSNSMVLEF